MLTPLAHLGSQASPTDVTLIVCPSIPWPYPRTKGLVWSAEWGLPCSMKLERVVPQWHLEGCLPMCLFQWLTKALPPLPQRNTISGSLYGAPVWDQVPPLPERLSALPGASPCWIFRCVMRLTGTGTSHASVCPAAGAALSSSNKISFSVCIERASPWSALLSGAAAGPPTTQRPYVGSGMRLLVLKEAGGPTECGALM